MRKVLFRATSILGAVFASTSNVAAQPLDGYYVPFDRAQPSYYLPPPGYAPTAGYIPAPSYVAPPDHYTLRVNPYARYNGARVYGYAPPPIAEYLPPSPVLIPLRPRSCGRYRYWNGEFCADARYARPYLGPHGDSFELA